MNEKKSKLPIKAIYGSLVAVAISLIAILIFAFIIKITGLSDGFIKPVNQVIKIVSILFGVRFVASKFDDNPILLGLLVGVCFTIIAFLVFSLLNGAISLDKSLFNDTVFGGISGAICGIIFARKKVTT